MADILIRGMEMPKHCIDCPLMVDRFDTDACALQSEEANEAIENWEDMRRGCPIVPLPKKHGRLIDAEAYVDYMQNRYDNNEITNGDWIDFRLSLKDQPTIVPAEGGTDNGN